MKVKIIKMGINGEGIAYVDRIPVFVPQTLPQEEVDITITQRHKRYLHAKVNHILSKSKFRIKPNCPYQHKCGGCPLMISRYEAQLEEKRELLKQSLIKYAQVDPHLIKHVQPAPAGFAYRNQCKLPCAMVNGRLTTGMYLPNSNYFQEVEHCIIHEEGLERIRKQVLKVLNDYECRAYDYHKKLGIRSLIIRGFDNAYQVCIVSGEEALSESCIEALLAIRGVVSLWQSYHTVKKTADMFGSKMIHLGGRRRLELELDGLHLQLSPRSFFQLNTEQAKQLYRCVAALVPAQNDLLVEAYSGIGAISLYVRDKAKQIIGIESIKDAVVNANENAKRNHAAHVSFLCADAADKCTYLAKKHKIDTLIVDPPRSGLDDAMLECMLRSKIKNIIYISCNPATLGKNLAILKERYEVKQVIPFDMFPQTAHVETVCLLSKIQK